MSEHTKEPWDYDTGGDVTKNDGTTLFIRKKSFEVTLDESFANTRRVVACVNACAGIETEKLEAVAFLSPHLPAGLKDKAIDYAQLMDQRDKLLAAMKLLSGMKLGMVANGIVDKAIAEIEAAK